MWARNLEKITGRSRTPPPRPPPTLDALHAITIDSKESLVKQTPSFVLKRQMTASEKQQTEN